MKQVVDFILYFFLGIDKKRKARRKKSKFGSVSDVDETISREAFDISTHIDFTLEN